MDPPYRVCGLCRQWPLEYVRDWLNHLMISSSFLSEKTTSGNAEAGLESGKFREVVVDRGPLSFCTQGCSALQNATRWPSLPL